MREFLSPLMNNTVNYGLQVYKTNAKFLIVNRKLFMYCSINTFII